MILDPRHKQKKFSKTEWGKQLEKESMKCFKKIYKIYYDNLNIDANGKEIKLKKNENNNNLLDFSAIFEADTELDFEEELNTYLEAPCASEGTDILLWWGGHEKTYPILSAMARDKLAVQATSVPVERLFSNAGLVDQPKRRSMKDDAFTALLIISAWSKSDLVTDICGFNEDSIDH